MGRRPCCAKEEMNRGAWTAMEDKILIEYVKVHGEGRWRKLPKRAGLKRCGKSCRLRWLNYLRPDIKRGNITPAEEELIIRLHKLLGNRWSLIAGRLPGRTDNEIKNYWNTILSKRVNHHYKTDTSPTNQQQRESRTHQKNKQAVSNHNGPNLSPKELARSNVIRPKAVRCPKVFINPPEPLQPSTENVGPQPDPTGHDNKDCVADHISQAAADPKDLDLGDGKIMSELLDSDFLNFFDFSSNGNFANGSNNNDNQFLLPNSEEYHPFVFSQELLDDWLVDRQL